MHATVEGSIVKYLNIIAFLLSLMMIPPAYAGAGHEGNTFSARKKQKVSRWYNKSSVRKGEKIYQQHCASCHQADASGVKAWREKDEKGYYPAPALNGTAHTWHHSLDALRRTVSLGGKRLGGRMPAFSEKLNEKEIDYVLSWVQSHWSDSLYEQWVARN